HSRAEAISTIRRALARPQDSAKRSVSSPASAPSSSAQRAAVRRQFQHGDPKCDCQGLNDRIACLRNTRSICFRVTVIEKRKGKLPRILKGILSGVVNEFCFKPL